jgi:hypothetical protein
MRNQRDRLYSLDAVRRCWFSRLQSTNPVLWRWFPIIETGIEIDGWDILHTLANQLFQRNEFTDVDFRGWIPDWFLNQIAERRCPFRRLIQA